MQYDPDSRCDCLPHGRSRNQREPQSDPHQHVYLKPNKTTPKNSRRDGKHPNHYA